MRTTSRRVLSNGLRVIVVPLPHLHSASLALLVRTGSRHETPATNGISHLVEHLLFRGTQRHPSSFEFNAAVESLGGEINGLTQRDATMVHMTVPPSSVEQGLQLLGDICARPTLSGIDIERSVVIEEILDTTDGNGCELDLDSIARSVIWEGHPIGLPVAGTIETVDTLTEAECRAHYARTFVAENAVLCIAGCANPDEVFAVAERAFGGMPRGQRLDEGTPPTHAINPAIHVQETDDSQVALLLSFPAPDENHPDFSTLALLQRVLDDGLASRLRQDVCEQRGLAYSVSATMDVYSDVGALDMDAHCSPPKLIRTVRQMLATLATLVEDGIGPAELARIKTRHRAELVFALDDVDEMSGWYGASTLLGCTPTYEDRLHEAMRVTADDITRLAARIFDPSQALLTLVGPVDEEHTAELERLLGRAPESTMWLNAEEEDEDDLASSGQLPFPALAWASF